MAGTNKNRSQLDALSLQNFPNNTNQDISPADLREWLEDATASFVTQKDKSTLENVLIEAEGVSLVAAPTVNLASATGNFLHVTGNSVINSFGIVNAGARFVIVFDGVCNLVYNSTQLILPGMSNITTAAGDCIMLVSEGNGDWRVIGYFSASGSGSGTITGVTAGTGLSGGGTSGTVTLDLDNTAVTPGAYTNADITVDAQGRITAAANGTGGGITALTGDVTASGTGSVAATIANGAVDIAMLSATGTPDATTFLRGDNFWATPAGGNPGGSDTQIQYNNGGTAFGGVSDLTWDDVNNVLTINTPRIGQSTGNGHLHLHTINTNPPTGLTDYVTLWADKSPKQVGYRFEQDGFTSAFEFGATADRVYTLPDAAGNIVIDSASQALSNKSFTNPTSFSNGTSAAEIRLLEPSGAGSEYVAIKAPATLAGNVELTLPNTAGTSGFSLITDGFGQLSWAINGGALASKRVTKLTQVGGGVGASYLTIDTMLIPANTFSTGDVIKLNVTFFRNNSGVSGGYRVYLNTSTSAGGVTLIGNTALSLGQTGVQAVWNLILTSSTETIINNNISTIVSPRNSNPNINWGVNQHIILQGFTGSTSPTDLITSNLFAATLL